MAAEQAWYIAERAEALAALFLTRREDLEIIPSGRYDRNPSYDLLVRIKTQNPGTDMSFGVEVKGVRSEKRRGKNSFLVSYAHTELLDAGLPICVFLFAVDDEQGYYRWLLEPEIASDGNARLRFGLNTPHDTSVQGSRASVRSEFDPLTDHAIDSMVALVKEWYQHKRQTMTPSAIAVRGNGPP